MPRPFDPELVQKRNLTREQARGLRQSAKALRRSAEEGRGRARELMARARYLRARHQRLETQEADQFREKPQKRNRFHARRLEVLEQLKQSLSDLESIRMTPKHDPELLELKDDIRKTIASGEAAEINQNPNR